MQHVSCDLIFCFSSRVLFDVLLQVTLSIVSSGLIVQACFQFTCIYLCQFLHNLLGIHNAHPLHVYVFVFLVYPFQRIQHIFLPKLVQKCAQFFVYRRSSNGFCEEFFSSLLFCGVFVVKFFRQLHPCQCRRVLIIRSLSFSVCLLCVQQAFLIENLHASLIPLQIHQLPQPTGGLIFRMSLMLSITELTAQAQTTCLLAGFCSPRKQSLLNLRGKNCNTQCVSVCWELPRFADLII